MDETATFFLQDTAIRLGRLVELALGYCGFTLLLYCRLLTPGGIDLWRWIQPGFLWVLIFIPLFILDVRNIRYWKYIQTNASRFNAHDGQRCFLIFSAECAYKLLLCWYLVCKPVRAYLTLKVVMFPYALGYVLHFLLGHFVPMEDLDRAESCNVVAAIISDLSRFLSLVFIVSLSLKVDNSSDVVYNWQAAFWPCWGLEGILILLVALLLPVCLISVVVDRPKMLMLTWVLGTCLGLGVASFMSMYNVAYLLDHSVCSSMPCTASGSADDCAQCHLRLQMSLWPWLVFLPSFSFGTIMLKNRLARALHAAWYQPARPRVEDLESPNAAPVPVLPLPTVMFRVTPTFYARSYDVDHEYSVHCGRSTVLTSLHSAHSHHRSLDPSTSILSARGSAFEDVVETEQLCFICYSQAPDTVLLECGHAGLCADCAIHLMERRPGRAVCPICRSLISAAMRLRPELPLPSDLFVKPPRSVSFPNLAQREANREARTHMVPWRSIGESLDYSGVTTPMHSEHASRISTGPPWPPAAKRRAVAVEEVRQLHRSRSTASNWFSLLWR